MFPVSQIGTYSSRYPPWPFWYTPESQEEAEEFNKAREDVRCWLVATGKGCVNFAKLDRLMEAAGVQVDFQKFRFKNFCEFLFHCQDFIEIRMYKPDIVPDCKSRFLFLKPEGVKENMAHVDRMVQGQRMETPKYKKNGYPVPTYKNTHSVPPRMLISSAYFNNNYSRGLGGYFSTPINEHPVRVSRRDPSGMNYYSTLNPMAPPFGGTRNKVMQPRIHMGLVPRQAPTYGYGHDYGQAHPQVPSLYNGQAQAQPQVPSLYNRQVQPQDPSLFMGKVPRKTTLMVGVNTPGKVEDKIEAPAVIPKWQIPSKPPQKHPEPPTPEKHMGHVPRQSHGMDKHELTLKGMVQSHSEGPKISKEQFQSRAPEKPKQVAPEKPKQIAPEKPKQVALEKPKQVTLEKPKGVAPEKLKGVNQEKPKDVMSHQRTELQTSSKANGINQESKLEEWLLRIELTQRSGVLVA